MVWRPQDSPWGSYRAHTENLNHLSGWIVSGCIASWHHGHSALNAQSATRRSCPGARPAPVGGGVVWSDLSWRRRVHSTNAGVCMTRDTAMVEPFVALAKGSTGPRSPVFSVSFSVRRYLDANGALVDMQLAQILALRTGLFGACALPHAERLSCMAVVGWRRN
jgi:hypothetical protein